MEWSAAAVAISLGRYIRSQQHTFEQSNDDDGGTVRQAAPASAQQQSVLDGSPHTGVPRQGQCQAASGAAALRALGGYLDSYGAPQFDLSAGLHNMQLISLRQQQTQTSDQQRQLQLQAELSRPS